MKKIIKIAIVIFCIIIAVVTVGGFIFTPQLDELQTGTANGTIPFSSVSKIKCNYYRIPSLITTSDGTLIAGADARYSGTKDSPNNIDTAVSISEDLGEIWQEPEIVLSFSDWESTSKILKSDPNLGITNSASTIDSVLFQDTETGRIFLITDVFPYGVGVSNTEKGSGYCDVNSEKCLMLKKRGSKNYGYYADSTGVIFTNEGEKTEYCINENFEILKDGEPLTVKQKKQIYWYNISLGINTKNKVAMNIMYENALFQPVSTSYIYMIYSDDNGKTWSKPLDLNSEIKSDDAEFMGTSPGRGIQIENGKYKGRLIFTAYYRDTETGQQKFTSVYSDDHGESWNTGKAVELTEEINNLSETQVVQFPDGSLQAFSRSTMGKAVSSYSTDAGITWSQPFAVDEIPLPSGFGCQLSAINCQDKIDGKDAVILSAPSGENRKNGILYVGLISKTENDGFPYEIEWKYKKEITDKDTDFAYSCLTQLPNSDIGILYESSTASQAAEAITFKSYSVKDLCGNS